MEFKIDIEYQLKVEIENSDRSAIGSAKPASDEDALNQTAYGAAVVIASGHPNMIYSSFVVGLSLRLA